MKEIYLIRHGQTEYNRLGYVQGSGVDASLNETGRAQAQAFFQRHQQVPFAAVYTSALRRTRESVEGFLAQGVPHTVVPGLNEISWGESEGKQPDAAQNRLFYSTLKKWSHGETHVAMPGGESPDQVLARLAPSWQRIMQQVDESPILVCCHGRLMRVLLCHLMGRPLKHMDEFPHQNLGLYLLHYQQGAYTLVLRNQGPLD